jgi:predicted ribosomally synthesized peptide with nif11-like leader
MTLADLDRFLLLRETDSALHERLAKPMDLEGFLALAADYGFSLDESDVFAAQQREAQASTARALQRQQAQESRRLRNFIHG